MMPPPHNHPSEPDPNRVVEPDAEVAYTIDVVARVSGLSCETILHFHEQGLIAPTAGDTAGCECYDDETVHRLRRIEYLRTCYGMELAAIKLTLDLMDELEQLRAELRSRS
jgi:MerR family transcriptional regulator/heat shock protein HspR